MWWSLQLLVDRLGGTLYRPVSMEWFDEGYYKLYGNLKAKDPDRWIAKQYLVDTIFTKDYSHGIGRETYNGCLNYPKFNLMHFDDNFYTDINIDIVICSVHENEPYFAKLKEFYPNAKFIRQVGNDLDTLVDESLYPNLLASATAPYNAFKGHKILYRQEWDTTLFEPEDPINFNNIWSFQGDLEQFEDTWEFWNKLKHELPGYSFKAYGVGNDYGKIYPKRGYYKKMSEATFLVQSKGPWEGYGFVIHNAMWLGRPMIIKYSDYAGKLAEPLLIKDETYLEMTDPDIVEKIRYYSDPIRFKTMSDKCRQMFNEVVDFEKEGKLLEDFFANLK